MRHRLCGLSTYGLNGLEMEMSTPPTLQRGTADFTFTFYDRKQLQADLNCLTEWSEKWQMPFNTSKCRVMHLGRANSKFEYTMGDHTLEVTTEERLRCYHVIQSEACSTVSTSLCQSQ